MMGKLLIVITEHNFCYGRRVRLHYRLIC